MLCKEQWSLQQMASNPDTITRILNSAVRPVLVCGLEYVHQNKGALHNVEVTQATVLKAALGLKSYFKNTPLLQALKIQNV